MSARARPTRLHTPPGELRGKLPGDDPIRPRISSLCITRSLTSFFELGVLDEGERDVVEDADGVEQRRVLVDRQLRTRLSSRSLTFVTSSPSTKMCPDVAR